MARNSPRLAFIERDSARKATYEKCTRRLLKKASELSRDCGVEVCMVINGPDDTVPAIWPPSIAAVKQILGRFDEAKRQGRTWKNMDQEGFLYQRVSRVKRQLEELKKENRELEMEVKVIKRLCDGSFLENASHEELLFLSALVRKKQDEVRREIQLRMSVGDQPTEMEMMPVTPVPSFSAAGILEGEGAGLHGDGPSDVQGEVGEDTQK